jgi:REP element-mobilizing transposase RayT
MARQLRNAVGGYTYHVLNRANARVKIFENDKDYRLFEINGDRDKWRQPPFIFNGSTR